jgi:hypothetical protein
MTIQTIGDIVRRAMAHKTFEDFLCVHFPREEVSVWFLLAPWQDIEPALMGVTYTLKKQILRRIQEECAASPITSLLAICLESEHGALRAKGHFLCRSPERSRPHEAGQCY